MRTTSLADDFDGHEGHVRAVGWRRGARSCVHRLTSFLLLGNPIVVERIAAHVP